MARFWGWWTVLCSTVALVVWLQLRVGAFTEIARADNAYLIFGIVALGLLVDVWIGCLLFAVARGRTLADLTLLEFFCFAPPFLGLVGTVLGVKSAIVQSANGPATASAHDILHTMLPPVAEAMWSTAMGIIVVLFLGLNFALLVTGGKDG